MSANAAESTAAAVVNGKAKNQSAAAAVTTGNGTNGKPKNESAGAANGNGASGKPKNGNGKAEAAEMPEDPSVAAIKNAVSTLKASVNKGSSCENIKKNAKKVVELGEGNVAKALKNGKTKENSLKEITKTIQETITPITNACKSNTGAPKQEESSEAPAAISASGNAPAAASKNGAAASTNAAASGNEAALGNASGGARKSKRKSRKSKRKSRKSQSRRRR